MILNYPTNEVLVKMSECDWWFWSLCGSARTANDQHLHEFSSVSGSLWPNLRPAVLLIRLRLPTEHFLNILAGSSVRRIESLLFKPTHKERSRLSRDKANELVSDQPLTVELMFLRIVWKLLFILTCWWSSTVYCCVSCFLCVLLCVCSVFVCCCCVQYNLIKRFYRTFSDPFVFLQQDSDEKRRKDLADKTRVCFIRPQPDFIISRRLLWDVLDGFVKVRRRPQLDGKISLKEQSDIFNKTVSLFIFTRSRGDDISFIWSAFSLA